jgi:tetratricopeptide (TPR) repeat protein
MAPLIFGGIALNSTQTVFALTPVADLTGEWSGFAQVSFTGTTCGTSGKVNGFFKQNENNLHGEFSFFPASSVSDDGTCGFEPWQIVVDGTLDGSRITLFDHSGMTFTGWYASSGIKLDFTAEWATGTTQLSPTNFTPPPFESKNNPPVEQDAPQVNEMIETGLSYLNEKRFDKALEYFSKIVQREPDNIMGWMGKGVSHVGLKNYDQAITHFKKSLEISPNNKDVLQWLARTYYLKNNCQMAVEYYSEALKVDPQNPKIMTEKKIADSCVAKQIETKTSKEADSTASASVDMKIANAKKDSEKKKLTEVKSAKEKRKTEAKRIEDSIKKKTEETVKKWNEELIKLDKQEIEFKAKIGGKILQYDWVQKKLVSMVGKDESSMSFVFFKHYSQGPDKSELAKADYKLEDIPPEWEDWIAKETKNLKDGRHNLSPYYDKKRKSGGPDDLVHTLGHFDVIVRTNPDGTRTYQIEDLYKFGYDLTKNLDEQRHGITFKTQNKEKLNKLMDLCSLIPPIEHPLGVMEKCEVIKIGNSYKILIPQQILAAAGNPFIVRGEFTK